ncbi:hypothetical protein M7I_0803 [Glarea lozoyensis 74030]|uniref:Uncharacterized protein n=1 Tax=Glarea lozoyensis (strain ATCC 74030 / MF5533) TaxID=1104152 RepID=H0EEC8_GLAL7|nr:hypothetical protein M7I_0803 [Glarea lozoyensis 74030]
MSLGKQRNSSYRGRLRTRATSSTASRSNSATPNKKPPSEIPGLIRASLWQ